MTERKDLEQQKDDFISIASHELRTPITSIKLYAEILEKHIQTTNDIQGKKYTSKINEQLKKLTELLNFLLDVSKIQSGKISLNYENANINNLITETVKVIQPTYKSHKIVIRGKVKGKIWIDKARISEVVINLISNAVKYSPQANEIIITLTQTDKKITISIKDFGIGIPKEEQKRIFDRFYRTKVIQQNQFPGIGLGLYIAYQIIKAHKGKMWVESENTKGSTFYFTLPGKSKAKKK
jgi:signal transduction histidine kinase